MMNAELQETEEETAKDEAAEAKNRRHGDSIREN